MLTRRITKCGADKTDHQMLGKQNGSPNWGQTKRITKFGASKTDSGPMGMHRLQIQLFPGVASLGPPLTAANFPQARSPVQCRYAHSGYTP